MSTSADTFREVFIEIGEHKKAKQILEKFDSWFKVIDAKARGVDVHHAPIKTHKLEIVAGNKTRFGQWLINRNEDC